MMLAPPMMTATPNDVAYGNDVVPSAKLVNFTSTKKAAGDGRSFAIYEEYALEITNGSRFPCFFRDVLYNPLDSYLFRS